MEITNKTYRVYQCSKCLEDTEYFCLSCPCDLCPRCCEDHVHDHKIIEQNIMICREKISTTLKQDMCKEHKKQFYEKYCEPCDLLICNHCTGHKKHRKQEVRIAFETKRQQYRLFIRIIRSDLSLYKTVLAGIAPDFKKCRSNISLCLSEMLTKAKILKNQFEDIIDDVCAKHQCSNQMAELRMHISKIQRYEHIFEQSTITPIKLLKSLKKTPKIYETFLLSNHFKLYMTDNVIKEDVIELLCKVQESEKEERSIRNNRLSKLMSVYELDRFLTVTCAPCCHHISAMTLDRVWVSYGKNIILINKAGDTVYHVKNLCGELYSGLHTINFDDELFYIDREYNIKKLSKDMKTNTTFIKKTCTFWRPRCVFFSQFTGHLLVGMVNGDKWTGKVHRYNHTKLIQIIQNTNAGQDLYRYPKYITENNNGDVIVADLDWSGAVVVTNRAGVHRFTYTGHPSGSELRPHGICTDALSRILVCDAISESVQMLDRDGHFLSYFLTKSEEIGEPCSLSFEVKTDRIWVGSYTNKVFVYRINNKQEALSGMIE